MTGNLLRQMAGYKDLEDYGIIGNLETCALSGRDGSIDWLCFPFLGSPSVFAALLDADKGGHFRISPEAKYESTQSYLKDTNVLETTFNTPTGVAVLTDFMPFKGKAEVPSIRTVLRRLSCKAGFVRLAVSFKPRFNYARGATSLRRQRDGILARGGGESMFLQSPVPLDVKGGEAGGKVLLKEGQSLWLALQYGYYSPMGDEKYEGLLRDTTAAWRRWAHRCGRSECVFAEPWHQLVVRSGLVLKLLANSETGAIAAAATTSLPESPGGVRNWDYRYAWIRDASFTDQALYHLGHERESRDFRRWNREIMRQAEEPSKIKVLYGLYGEEETAERVLGHLSGYRGSAPVRVGNAAAGQRQLDIFGEMLNAIFDTTRHGEKVSKDSWRMIRQVVDYVCQVWHTEDSGIWEMRGGPRHFVYSKLMCWVALDRGVRMAEAEKFEAPVKKWKGTREEIRRAILGEGYSKKLGSFVQSFGSEALDATGLLIPMMGFLPFDDRRVQGTINAALKRLRLRDGLLRRYEGEDDLPGREGAFLLCSFWLVKALALSGRVEEAERIFFEVLNYASPLGLFSEEVDPDTGRLLGNFPQAFSHIGLINSALYLGTARGRRHRMPDLVGTF
jgi:GH15 family glucan-1,4-alpha-glucosidase